jgi:hypothetical protein
MFQVPAPNYTQAPNSFFDDMAKTLKEGELRVLLIIERKGQTTTLNVGIP